MLTHADPLYQGADGAGAVGAAGRGRLGAHVVRASTISMVHQ